MKKVVLSVIAALAVSAAVPAYAADMPVKAYTKAPAPVVSPWDIAFGTAFTTDYVLRGVSQSNRRPAVQGYVEPRYTVNDWLQLYVGMWGSSLATYNANAEIDLYGGARLTYGNFGLDLGYVYYYYVDGGNLGVTAYDSYGEFYAKPSYKFNNWLSIGGVIDGGNNNNNGFGIVGSKTAYFYAGNATITLPWTPAGITMSINPEIGRQVVDCTGCTSYTYWDVGLVLNYKAATLDLRYWDTNMNPDVVPAPAFGSRNLSGPTFVATLKFDTTWSALK